MKELTELEQSPQEAESGAIYDVLVVASGYERRAPQVAQRLAGVSANRICLGFVENATADARLANDALFVSLGYKIELYSGDDYTRVAGRVARACAGMDDLRIAIDISSMTRAWYWAIIRRVLELPSRSVTFTFYYSVAEYEEAPLAHSPPRVLGPLPGISTALEIPDKPICLLMGLGYEPEKAVGLMEYLEPVETFLFYADPAADVRFADSVRRVNKEVLRRVDQQNVVRYRYSDLMRSFGMVESLLRGLQRRLRIIATPLGPKPFGLVLYLASLAHPSVDVWRVSGGTTGALGSRPPTGEVLVLRASFVENARGDVESAVASQNEGTEAASPMAVNPR